MSTASLSVFRGVNTAIVTPFRDGRVDESAFRALVQRQLAGGVHGLVPCGTTGEAPTLTVAEHVEVVRWTVEEAAGRVPVMAGIGSNNTAQAIETAKRTQDLGVQGVLATAPYYNKPTPEGLRQHFLAIAEAVEVEVCVYDVPGRTAVKVPVSTIAQLAEHPRITAVKDATGDLSNAAELRRLGGAGAELRLLSGDDFTLLPFWAVGGDGCISVLSNLVPAAVVHLHTLMQQGELAAARTAFFRMLPTVRALFLESNPAPIKAALARHGLCSEELRLPLVGLRAETRAALYAAMDGLED